MKTTDVAWLAGLFEGEGNIYLGSTKGVNHQGALQITIAMTDEDVIDRVNKLWPGKMYTRIHDKWKTVYVWRLYGQTGFDFLESILPHLGKRRTAKALEVLSVRPEIGKRKIESDRKAVEAQRLAQSNLSNKEIAGILGVTIGYIPKLLSKEVAS